MDIIRMTGGLGNQMFQYALYLKLKSMGRDVKLDDRTEYERSNARPLMLWAFDIQYPKATKEEISALTDGSMKFSARVRRKITGRKSLEYHEKDCNFDEQVLTRTPAYLTGYFQSEKYFADIEKQIREAFVFSETIWKRIPLELAKQFREYLNEIENTMAVSVHIRRGDYLANMEVHGGICTEEYYQKAISLMQKKFSEAVFFVFSNDMCWTKNWLQQAEGRFVPVEGTKEDTGYLDMWLMSRCKHHIIANSSFSWWGSWLSSNPDKVIMAPHRWFGNQECVDIYTREMIRILPDTELLAGE